MATNPIVQQGTLNRVRASVVVPSYTNLNIDSSHMSRKFVTVTFDEDFVDQPMTATGIVNSPAPYVMATISVGILRTQSLSASWFTQAQTQSVLGRITVHPDTTTFPQITAYNCSILRLEPGAQDGTDPTVDLTIRGIFYPNSDLWNLT